MKYKSTFAQKLLQISQKLNDYDPQSKTVPEIQNLIKIDSIPWLKTCKLNIEHIYIIAKLFDKNISGSKQIDPLQILKEIFIHSQIILRKMDLVLDLVKSRVINIERIDYVFGSGNNCDSNVKLKQINSY